MKAMLFAAGLGKRLGDITRSTPKALVTINGKSVLRINIEKITSSGFDNIIVNIHHFSDQVIQEVNTLRKEGYKITISDETYLLLETGGGLYNARWFFDDEPFLLYNTDILTSLNLEELLNYHLQKGGIATIAVRKRPGNRFFLVDSNSLLRGWCNRSTGEEIISRAGGGTLTEAGFSGIHIVNPAIFRYMHEGIYSLTKLYLDIAASEDIFAMWHDNDEWWDIGTPSVLHEVRNRYNT